jgi:hypothetical protein
MRAYIIAEHAGHFPQVLLPYNGKSVINYVIDEVLLQKQVSSITVVAPLSSQALIRKHLASAYPDYTFEITDAPVNDPNEHIVLDGSVYTTLRLQDLIRYYQQYKTITYSAYDKTTPKPIPFTIYPVLDARDTSNTHTYNCGTCLYKVVSSASNRG